MPSPPVPRQLLAAMSTCAPEGFHFDLAAQIADMDEGAALAALRELVARSLVEEIDRDERRYRLHALVRATARDERFDGIHAEAIQQRFEAWEANWKRCEQELPDFFLALEWALKNGTPAVGDLAYTGYSLTVRVGRLGEAVEICGRMRQVSEESQDRSRLQAGSETRH